MPGRLQLALPGQWVDGPTGELAADRSGVEPLGGEVRRHLEVVAQPDRAQAVPALDLRELAEVGVDQAVVGHLEQDAGGGGDAGEGSGKQADERADVD